jgi:hypothetical protein
MDIVGAMAKQLNLEEGTAAGLVGAGLLLIEDLIRERIGYAAGAQLRESVPELRDWQTSAPTIAPGMLSLDNLPPPSAPGDEGEFAAVLSRFGVGPEKTTMVGTLLVQFLSRRLDGATLDTLIRAIPMLG